MIFDNELQKRKAKIKLSKKTLKTIQYFLNYKIIFNIVQYFKFTKNLYNINGFYLYSVGQNNKGKKYTKVSNILT